MCVHSANVSKHRLEPNTSVRSSPKPESNNKNFSVGENIDKSLLSLMSPTDVNPPIFCLLLSRLTFSNMDFVLGSSADAISVSKSDNVEVTIVRLDEEIFAIAEILS